jgi:L-ascorbate metabolism protein UlaG (beta-lactamase superfamily)
MKKIYTLTILGIACLAFTSGYYWKNPMNSQSKEEHMNVENIHWYGQAAFRVEDDGQQIYIDPWKLPEKGLPKADIILITHAHFDHFSPDDIGKVMKDKTILVAPRDVASKLKGTIKTVGPKQSLEIGKLKITTVPAYNLKKDFHPKSNNWVGYLITLSSGQTLYHAGDTDFIPEMKSLRVDIAFLPCGGTYTMDAKEAAEAANSFKPKITIPMHYGDVVGSDQDAQTFKKVFQNETIIKQREH